MKIGSFVFLIKLKRRKVKYAKVEVYKGNYSQCGL